MDNIELLIKLQSYYNKLNEVGKVLKDKKKLVHLKNMKEDYNKKLRDYSDIKNRIDEFEKKYFDIINEIEQIKVDIKLLEESLYRGSNGCNIKLINNTQSRIISQTERLKELEKCKKKVLNDEEELMNLKQNYEEKLEEGKTSFYNLKNEVMKKLKNAKQNKLKYEKLIIDVRKDISKDILKIVDELNSKKYPAVVPIINETCSGCKMNLSIISMNNLMNNKDGKLLYCENCGRIIYIP